MRLSFRTIFPLLLSVLLLTSCQSTNLSDLIEFRKISADKVQDYQKEVTITSSRDAFVLDSLDKRVGTMSLSKGTKIRVLGLYAKVGSFKTDPSVFSSSFDGKDLWLAELKGGKRVFVSVPEMYSGEKPIYSSQVAIYFPHRQNRSFSSEIPEADQGKLWPKVVVAGGKIVTFMNNHSLSRYLYKDGSFYLFIPIINSVPQWVKRVVQAILSSIFMLILFVLVVPFLSLNAVWHIRFIPNWLVKILCSILCYVLAFFFGMFFGVTAIGFVIWGLMLVTIYTSSISLDVDWNRCPHCHKVGIHYKDTVYGKTKVSRSERDKEEVKSESTSEHDEYTGVGVKHVKTTTRLIGTKHYTTIRTSRSVTDNLKCPHCGRDIVLSSVEETLHESSHWA